MKDNSSYSLRYVEEKDLNLILEWRNSDRVRFSMFHTDKISFPEHYDWFKNLDKKKNHYLIFEHHARPVGVVYFNDVDFKNGSCFWGFYLGATDVPKGTGTIMGKLGIEFAFMNLKVEKIYGEVLLDNDKSISFHERLGFSKEKLVKNFYVNNKYVDVVYFELSKNQWEKQEPI